MSAHAGHQGMCATGILYIVKLTLERVYFLAQGLKLVPGIGLSRLHLAQLHVVLLHLLFNRQVAAAATAAGAATHAATQGQSRTGQSQNVQITECAHSTLFQFCTFPRAFLRPVKI